MMSKLSVNIVYFLQILFYYTTFSVYDKVSGFLHFILKSS